MSDVNPRRSRFEQIAAIVGLSPVVPGLAAVMRQAYEKERAETYRRIVGRDRKLGEVDDDATSE